VHKCENVEGQERSEQKVVARVEVKVERRLGSGVRKSTLVPD
jgi:hypothetical protein